MKLFGICFFDSFIGSLFYQYARRRDFIKSFSIKELFGEEKDVDDEWLDMLEKAATNSMSRYAVFFFSGWFLAKRLLKINGKIRSKNFIINGRKSNKCK